MLNNERGSWITYFKRTWCFLVECHKVNQLVDMGSLGHNFSCSAYYSSWWKNNSKIELCLKYIMNCSHEPQSSKIIIHERWILQAITGPSFVWQYHLLLLCLFHNHFSVIIDSTIVIDCPVNTSALAIKTTCYVFPTSGFSSLSQVSLHFSVMLTFKNPRALSPLSSVWLICVTIFSSVFIFITIHVSIPLLYHLKVEDNYLWSWSWNINIKTVFLHVCDNCLLMKLET